MKPTATTLTKITLASALAVAGLSNSVLAGNRANFSDYARVVHVEPAYRYVTVKTPQRVCTPGYRHQPARPAPRQQRRHSNHTRADSYRHDSAGAVFIGGLIGGAIGREVSKTVNGRPSAGATITGAVIGSTLAGAAAHSNSGYRGTTSQNQGNYGHNRPYVTSTQHHRNSRQTRSDRQGRHFRDQSNHNAHNLNRQHQQRCTTTTQTSRERRADGYNVTYMYKGRSFNTHTLHHPGNRIQVEISLSPKIAGR